MNLTAVEARVLGCLMEKEMGTPEYYPLSLNSLLAACNQKTSREPVMTVTEQDARSALRSLEDGDLVSVDHGSRVQRYEHRARTVYQLRRDETAILCLLLLRGPQTPGELRGRSDRLHAFEDLPAVQTALARMAAPSEQRAEAIVIALPRGPGSKEQRYAHLLSDADTASRVGESAPSAVLPVLAPNLEARVTVLEQEIAALRALVDRLAH